MNNSTQQWIPISDPLPQDQQELLFLTLDGKCKHGRFFVVDNYNRADMFYGEFGFFRKEFITHWLPLPPLPKTKLKKPLEWKP